MKRKVMLAVAASVVALMPVMAQAANKLIVKDATGTTDKMVVTDTGYVGIGTNAPAVPLHLKGTNINDTKIISHYTGTTSGGGGNILMFHNNDPATNNGLPQANDRLGNLMFGSYIGSLGVAGAGISAYADGVWTNSSAPTYLSFQTAPAGTTGRADRMRITSVGNVGINTVSPTQKLEVNGGIRINTTATKPTCSLTIRGTMWFTQAATGVADTLEVCAKQANGTYAWMPLF